MLKSECNVEFSLSYWHCKSWSLDGHCSRRDGPTPHNRYERAVLVGTGEKWVCPLVEESSVSGQDWPAQKPLRPTSWVSSWPTLTSTLSITCWRKSRDWHWRMISERSFYEAPLMVVYQRSCTKPNIHFNDHLWVGVMDKRVYCMTHFNS